jgi:NAD(P)-dependent dehydrogenase (short-subunit alcohol dehydrogenase family)
MVWPLSSSSPAFDPSTIPSLSSKVIIVTGGNAGVGKETVLQLSKHSPERLYLAARSKDKATSAIASIVALVPTARIDFLPLDLSSFASVKAAADTVLRENDHLDILINNAGVMNLPPGLTSEGYELQFGTNHMGHALFTKLLMPLLSRTAAAPNSDVRILNLSSAAHARGLRNGLDLEKCKTEMTSNLTWSRYAQSKLANVLFAKELAKRYPAIKSVAIHPGRVETNLLDVYNSKPGVGSTLMKMIDVVIMVPVDQGAWNQLWAATVKKEALKSGAYYSPVGKAGGESTFAKNEKLAKKLWEWTEGEFAAHGY